MCLEGLLSWEGQTERWLEAPPTPTISAWASLHLSPNRHLVSLVLLPLVLTRLVMLALTILLATHRVLRSSMCCRTASTDSLELRSSHPHRHSTRPDRGGIAFDGSVRRRAPRTYAQTLNNTMSWSLWSLGCIQSPQQVENAPVRHGNIVELVHREKDLPSLPLRRPPHDPSDPSCCLAPLGLHWTKGSATSL